MMASARPGDWRVVTLNIRDGGTKHADPLRARLLGYDADILVVTEFRANDAGERLVLCLRQAGYAMSHPATDRNSLLIASRNPIDRSWAFDAQLDAHRLWCVDIGGTVVCGAMVPSGQAKRPYWQSLIDAASRSGIDLVIGDFNTGIDELDREPVGYRFPAEEMAGHFLASGYVDLWRSRNPDQREYSYVSRTNNGFRIDHAFALPEFAQRVSGCEFDHTPRLLNETDHSALIVTSS